MDQVGENNFPCQDRREVVETRQRVPVRNGDVAQPTIVAARVGTMTRLFSEPTAGADSPSNWLKDPLLLHEKSRWTGEKRWVCRLEYMFDSVVV